MFQTNKTLWWMLVVILVAITGFALYKLIVKAEPAYIQFTIVAALGGSILRETPLFIKYKYLNGIPAIAAVVLLAFGIITEINN